MIYQIIQPHPALKPFVKEYMLVHFNFKGLAGEQPSRLLEARAEQSIILYPSGLFTKVNPVLDKRLAIPHTIVQGQLLTGWYHHYPEDFKFVKIIFQPGGLFHLLGQIPSTHFTDAVTDAESVLGTEMTEIIQQLMNTEQYPEMIRVTDTYLLAKFGKLKLRIEPIDRINHLLRGTATAFGLDYLADQACLSYRQFERKFKERNGVSPKLFVRIARFNRAYTMKEKNPTKDWLDVAISCGYSDYQHMVKDFKQFAGVTPVAMLEAHAKRPEKVLGLHNDVVF
ncbi:helix-turn-helix domain-containing protein [Spirosoma arcticum]